MHKEIQLDLDYFGNKLMCISTFQVIGNAKNVFLMLTERFFHGLLVVADSK